MTRSSTTLSLAFVTILLAPAAAASAPSIPSWIDPREYLADDTWVMPMPDGGSSVKNVVEAVMFLFQQAVERIMGGLPNSYPGGGPGGGNA